MTLEYVQIKRLLRCKTGLRIGGSKDDVEIGGLDNPILRDPLTLLPYIPGSSLKGKLRSCLERKYVQIDDAGNPCGCARKDCLICTIFGAHIGGLPREKRRDAEARLPSLKPTRIIVRDAFITRRSAAKLKEILGGEGLCSEIKQEVSIDRNTGRASRAGPRPMERIPAGTEFALNIVIRIFEGDPKDKFINFVEEGLKLIQNDYLGGSGSRGYGWIEILPSNEDEGLEDA